MRKKILIFIFIFTSLLSYAKLKVGFIIDSKGLGANSFYDITYRGISRAQAMYDFDLYMISSRLDLKSREESFQSLIDKKVDIIVSNGIYFEKELIKFSYENPKVYFLVNDRYLEGGENIQSIVYRQNEGALLIGYLMGKMTKSKKIAFLGGVDIEVIEDFKLGFFQGVGLAGNDIEVIVEYIAKDPEKGFNSPKKAYKMAKRLYREGVDIIFPVAGESSHGVIQAAKEEKKYLIGIDNDQDEMAKGLILCSLLKNMDKLTFEVLEHFIQTREFESGVRYSGIESGGVSLSKMKYTKKIIPACIIEEMKILEKRIIEKDLIVDTVEDKKRKEKNNEK